jgi:hypothetical protein
MASSTPRIRLDTGAWRRARAERVGKRAALWAIPLGAVAVLAVAGVLLWGALTGSSGSHHVKAAAAVKHASGATAGNPPAATLQAPTAVKLPAPRTVVVAVWNTSGTSGAAGRAATPLRAAGFRVVSIMNAKMSLARTTVFYVPGAQAAAIAVARRLGLDWRSTAPLDGMSTKSVRPARVIVAVA